MAKSFGFSPPAIPGVGTSGGFTFILEDRSCGDVKFLSDNLNRFMAAARQRQEIGSLSTTFLHSVPQQFIKVDRDKVIKQGVVINDVYRTIQTFMGGLFVNYFNRFGRQPCFAAQRLEDILQAGAETIEHAEMNADPEVS